MNKRYQKILCILLVLMLSLTGCTVSVKETGSKQNSQDELHTVVSNEREVTDISDPYMIVDENVPGFSEDEITTESFEHYSELDALGRCGVATACIGTDLMPTEKRGNISRVKPTGWHSIQYDSVEGKSLYNRCHLIAHQLAGEDANEKNLITGTRYMNVSGMLPFEEEVGDYVRETGNHVMYRVTPVFEGDNLLADGVQMEAYSVEDQGKGVSYNVYIFNAQPGIWILSSIPIQRNSICRLVAMQRRSRRKTKKILRETGSSLLRMDMNLAEAATRSNSTNCFSYAYFFPR